MNEETAVVDQVEEAAPEQAQPEERLSITEHAKQFAKDAPRETETEEQKAHHSAEQKREKDGKFDKGKVRHRAASQQARPEDVPRIKELTAWGRGLEDQLKAATEELARLKSQGGTKTEIAAAQKEVTRTQAAVDDFEPEPNENDEKYGGDYTAYLKDLSRHAGRKAVFEAQKEQREQAEAAKRQEGERQIAKTFSERVTAAQAKYQDFNDVAFTVPIPENSLVDQFIMHDEAGPDVLYYLASHRQELGDLLALAPIPQMKALSLLSQRFESPSTRTQDANTGSSASRQVIVMPPRPPNPVRTEAQRASDGPPPTDGTLSIMSHAKAFRRS